jgi:hypothetical protein
MARLPAGLEASHLPPPTLAAARLVVSAEEAYQRC